MAQKVSKKQAEQVVQAIKILWPVEQGWSHQDGPTLYPAEHEGMRKGCWSIAWEGAPEDWTQTASSDIKVEGVFLEPMASWCLGLYPEDVEEPEGMSRIQEEHNYKFGSSRL